MYYWVFSGHFQIELQSAVNKSEAVRDNKPQYILTKTQKIYFFSQPTLDSAKNLQLGGDGSEKVNQVRPLKFHIKQSTVKVNLITKIKIMKCKEGFGLWFIIAYT